MPIQQQVAAEYRPWTGRKFGIEMEMRTTRTNGQSLEAAHLMRALTSAGVGVNNRQPGYYHSDGRTWDVKTDSSCGWEVASPAMTMDPAGECVELRDATAKLAELRPRIDRTCGLHVHVELSDFNWEDVQRLVSIWCRYEPFFYGMMPPSRWNNGYCMPACRSRWTDTLPAQRSRWECTREAIQAGNEGRFNDYARNIGRVGINLAHWWTSARIEFRLGAGSVDYTKIRNWTMWLLALTQRVKERSMPAVGPYTMIRAHEFPVPYIAKIIGVTASEHRQDAPARLGTMLVEWAESRRLMFARQAGAAGVPQID